MAISQSVKIISRVSSAAISIYRFANINGQNVANNTTAGAFCDGITNEDIAASEVGREVGIVVPDGAIAKLEAGAAFAVNANLASDTSGRGITAVPGNAIMAKALEAATAAGDIVEVQLLYRGQQS